MATLDNTWENQQSPPLPRRNKWWRWHHATWASVQGLPWLMEPPPALRGGAPRATREQVPLRRNKQRWWAAARTPAYFVSRPEVRGHSTVLGLTPVPAVGGLKLDYHRWRRAHTYPSHFQVFGLRGKLREWAPLGRTHRPKPVRRRHSYPYLWLQPQLHLSTIPMRLIHARYRRRKSQMTLIQRQCCTFSSSGVPNTGDKTTGKVE